MRGDLMSRCCFVCFLFCFFPAAPAQQTISLWAKGAPGMQSGTGPGTVRITADGEHVVTHVLEPSITSYLPSQETATGAAVIVIPGGGHSEIWIDHEGYAVAEWLRSQGVAAFVLQYRLAREKGSTYTVEGTELADTQRAIRTVRNRSKEWGIDPQRIGIIGFSAGGELAELASTRYDEGLADSGDATNKVSSRPNFQALLYPAIPHDPRLTADTPQKLLPAPNLVGANPYLNNYRVVTTNPSLSQWYVGKVDYVPTQSHRLSVSYMDFPITLVNGADAFCALGFDCSNGSNYNMDGQITDVWTINNHMVNEARVGGVREKDLYIPPTFGKGYPTSLGLQPGYGTNAPGDIFPTITIDRWERHRRNRYQWRRSCGPGRRLSCRVRRLYPYQGQAHDQDRRRVRQELSKLHRLGGCQLRRF
jgi:hypothetical protein